MKKLALLALVSLVAGIVMADEPTALSQAFFGVNLGEPLKALGEKCRNAAVSADGDKWHFQDKDHPGRIISLNGALNGNKSIKETKVSVYSNRVYEIELIFADASLQNYNVLKESLEKKYGKNKAGLFDAMETKSHFTTTVDGQSVSITLNHDIAFNEEGGTMSVSYQYDAIQKMVVEDMNRRKAAKVADDL